MWIEKVNTSDKLLKKAESVFYRYMSNYSCRPWDEDEVDLDELKIFSSKMSETETLEVIEAFLYFIDKRIEKNVAEFDTTRDESVIRQNWLKIIKEILNSRKSKIKEDSKVKEKVKDIVK